MNLTRLLRVLAFVEAATGVALLAVPSVVIWALFGAGAVHVGLAAARVAGAALVGLGFACWPTSAVEPARAPVLGMSAYSFLAAGVLAWIAFVPRTVGFLRWPAVLVHLASGVSLLVLQGRGPGDHNLHPPRGP